MLEIGSYCGKSAIYLGAAAASARHRAVRPRPPPGLRGEPARLGVARARPGRSRPSAASTPCRPSAAPSSTPASRASVVALVGDSPTVGRHWQIPLSLLFIDGGHGSRTRPPRLRDLDPVGRRWAACWSSTTCSRTRPTAVARRSRSTPGPCESGAFDDVSATGSLRVLRRTAGSTPVSRSRGSSPSSACAEVAASPLTTASLGRGRRRGAPQRRPGPGSPLDRSEVSRARGRARRAQSRVGFASGPRRRPRPGQAARPPADTSRSSWLGHAPASRRAADDACRSRPGRSPGLADRPHRAGRGPAVRGVGAGANTASWSPSRLAISDLPRAVGAARSDQGGRPSHCTHDRLLHRRPARPDAAQQLGVDQPTSRPDRRRGTRAGPRSHRENGLSR